MTEGLQNDIIDELKSRGISAKTSDSGILFSAVIDTIKVDLICKLGAEFPYTFPKVFVAPESKEKLKGVPHQIVDDSICVFDEGLAIPNFYNPVQMVVETIIKAINVLDDGIHNVNRWDFLDEFNEYWNAKTNIKANSFISELTHYKTFCFCFQPGENAPILIAESAEKLKAIFAATKRKELAPEEIHTGLLIPIDQGLECSIPKSDQDIVRLIQKHSSFSNDYEKYIRCHTNRTVLLILSQITERGTILSGWVHHVPSTPKGFRKEKVKLTVAFSLSKKKGSAFSVEDCSQRRLFNRGSDGMPIMWNSVAIIGCGSIGSFLADGLFYSGTSSFLLNDYQIILYENIARHTCGYSYKGSSKVDAIKSKLEQHNPNVSCKCFLDDAHVFLEEHSDELNLCDIIFVAVASFPVEAHICKLINAGIITKPVVMLWVEPYALGGHAVVLNGKQDLFEELFDASTFEFKNSFVSNYSDHYKREAGCSSTYIPYSGLYVQMFVTSIIERIMTETQHKKGNYLLSWCGRLSASAEYGVKLTTIAETYPDFSIIERRID